MLDDELGYMIADANLGTVPDCVRSMAFVEGTSSHTRVAVPDAVEDKSLKIGSPEQTPGVKVAAPEKEPGMKVVTPPGFSVRGDFSQTIKVSGEDVESRQKIGMKLYGSAMNPTVKVQPRRR